MNDSSPGFHFNETMEGPFGLGATEPVAGEAQGRDDSTFLAMHGSISIDNMQRFIDDPEHAATLGGTVDFTPFGEALPVSAGVFNLFNRAAEPGLKYMVYELTFDHDGETYFLAGRKNVRNDPGVDLWADTTTLFTHLHRGTSAEGEVVGAGILRIGAGGLARLVSTMRATGTSSATEQARTIASFGAFFMGELWDSYRPISLWGRILRFLRLR